MHVLKLFEVTLSSVAFCVFGLELSKRRLPYYIMETPYSSGDTMKNNGGYTQPVLYKFKHGLG